MKITKAHIEVANDICKWDKATYTEKVKRFTLPSQEKLQRTLRLSFLVIASCSILASLIMLVSYNWSNIHKFVKLGGMQVLLGGVFLWSFRKKNSVLLQDILINALCLLIGLYLVLHGQIYQSGANAFEFFFTWFCCVTCIVIVNNKTSTWFFFTILLNICIITYFEFYVNNTSRSLLTGADPLNLFLQNRKYDFLPLTVILSNSILATILYAVKTVKISHWFYKTLFLFVMIYLYMACQAWGIGWGISDSSYNFFITTLLLLISCVGGYFCIRKKLAYYFAVLSLNWTVILISHVHLLFQGDRRSLLFNPDRYTVILLVCLVIIILAGVVIVKVLIKLQTTTAKEQKNEKQNIYHVFEVLLNDLDPVKVEDCIGKYRNKIKQRGTLLMIVVSTILGSIAALMLTGLVFLLHMVDSKESSLIMGLIFIGGAMVMANMIKHVLIKGVTLAVFLSGVAFVFTFFIDRRGEIELSILILEILFLILSLVNFKNYLSFVSFVIFLSLLPIYLLSKGSFYVVHFHTGVCFILFAVLQKIDNSSSFLGLFWQKISKYIKYALLVYLLGFLGSISVTKYMLFPRESFWISPLIGVIALVLYLFSQGDRLSKPTSKTWGVFILIILFLGLQSFAFGILGSLILLVVCYMQNINVGVYIGVPLLIYTTAQNYYNLNYSLLEKAFLSGIAGLLLLSVYFILNTKKIKA